MSKTHLPDDISRWPQNPFELLDVTPEVESGELRKKYAALIRYYKPEQYPEQFQKIRAAYEIVRELIERRVPANEYDPIRSPPSPVSSPAPSPAPEPVPVPADVRRDPPASEPPADESVFESGEEVVQKEPEEVPELQKLKDSIWRIALEGEIDEAYRQLHRLVKTNEEDQSLYIRLYWMQVLFPDLDEVNPPSRWLVTGLLKSPHSSMLFELLRRELCHFPGETVTDRFLQLILSDLRKSDERALIRLRWETARASGNHVSTILNDLDQIEPRLQLDSQEVWVRVLVLALEHLVWSSDPLAESRVVAIQRTLDQVTDVRLGHEYQLDQLDQLVQLAKLWKETVAGMKSKDRVIRSPIDSDPLNLEELVPAFWTSTEIHYRTIVDRSIATIADDPHQAFEAIDHLIQHRSLLIIHISRILEQWIQFNYPVDLNEPTVEERTVISQFLRSYLERENKRVSFADFRTVDQKRADYHQFREQILDLVTSENIWFGSITYTLRSGFAPQPFSEGMAKAIEEDFPLRVSAMIHHLFWRSMLKPEESPDLKNLDYSDRLISALEIPKENSSAPSP